jgi:peroxiredoxin
LRELPAFEQFQAEQGTDGAVILAVNVAETGEAVTKYFDEQGISGLTVLLDTNQDVSRAFAIDRFPTTYVIDAAGVVRFKYYGEMTHEDMTSALEALT